MKKVSSRQRLLDAARKLFVTRGYHHTRPQDIANEAGLGHGTFYLHFADKKECFLAFLDQAGRELDVEIATETEGKREFPEQVRAVLTAITRYWRDNPGVLSLAMSDTSIIATGTGDQRESCIERWGRQWTKRLQYHAGTGQIDTAYNFDVIGPSFVGMIRDAMNAATVYGCSDKELVDNLTEFIIRGTAPKPSGG